jgi:hypothetical protein
MDPVGIFMGICIDLSKKKTKLNMTAGIHFFQKLDFKEKNGNFCR